MRKVLIASLAVSGLAAVATPVAGQDRPVAIVEASAGHAGFVPDSSIDHDYIGGGVRAYLTPKVAIGPEVVYMRRPHGEHVWFVTGNVTFDLVDTIARARPVVPYVVAGAGFFRLTEMVGTGPYTSGEATAMGGIGARIALGDRFFVAPELRLGWETHFRLGVTVGVRR
jgi:hypothetical protein